MTPCEECSSLHPSPLSAALCAEQDRADEVNRRNNEPFRSVN